jgi:hypothetical protein
MARLMASFGVTAASDHALMESESCVRRLKASLPHRVSVRALEEFDQGALLRIAHRWDDPHALEVLFAELLYQNETCDRSYDLRVLEELAALRDHARHHVHRVRRSVWDNLHD